MHNVSKMWWGHRWREVSSCSVKPLFIGYQSHKVADSTSTRVKWQNRTQVVIWLTARYFTAVWWTVCNTLIIIIRLIYMKECIWQYVNFHLGYKSNIKGTIQIQSYADRGVWPKFTAPEKPAWYSLTWWAPIAGGQSRNVLLWHPLRNRKDTPLRSIQALGLANHPSVRIFQAIQLPDSSPLRSISWLV